METIKLSDGKELNYKRIKNDYYGNPRYLFDFWGLLSEAQVKEIEERHKDSSRGSRGYHIINDKYNQALKNSRTIGGKRYKGKDFGGGIVISSYSLESSLEYMFEAIK